MQVPESRLEQLADRVARQLGFDRWEDDLVSREIASAEDLMEAARRLAAIIKDAKAGLEIVLAELKAG